MDDIKQYIYEQRIRWIAFRKSINTKIDGELARLDDLELMLAKGSNQAERVEKVVAEIEEGLDLPEKAKDEPMVFRQIKKGKGERE